MKGKYYDTFMEEYRKMESKEGDENLNYTKNVERIKLAACQIHRQTCIDRKKK